MWIVMLLVNLVLMASGKEIPWFVWLSVPLFYIGDSIRSYADGILKRLPD